MPTANDIIQFTDQMVRDCRLDSTSVFFYDRSRQESILSYVYHNGISSEAQHVYAARKVFMSDPFAQLSKYSNGFFRLDSAEIDTSMDQAADYRAFMEQYRLQVAGVWCRGLSSNLSLIIGSHQKDDETRRQVPLGLLEQRLKLLSEMAVDHLFEELLAHNAGRLALRCTLPSAVDEDVDALQLSAREMQIAALICEGKQNKNIAYQLGISEFTVENHLRRIYRKLKIHSRSALVSYFSRRAAPVDAEANDQVYLRTPALVTH
jgi:DNA-binding CsgD family transcriptional regulator